jgi:hypothetical protein
MIAKTERESITEYRLRLLSYTEKFESIYGPLTSDLKDAIINGPDPLAALMDPKFRLSVSSGIAEVLRLRLLFPSSSLRR